MEKSNPLSKTEGCSGDRSKPDLLYFRVQRPTRSVPREKREPQAGPASGLSNSASKVTHLIQDLTKAKEGGGAEGGWARFRTGRWVPTRTG